MLVIMSASPLKAIAILYIDPLLIICNIFIGIVAQSSRLLFILSLTLMDNEEGHLLIENCVNIFFVTSLSVSLHNLLDFYIYIRLKIKPNSVRIRFLSCQICVLHSTGFELTPMLIYLSIIISLLLSFRKHCYASDHVCIALKSDRYSIYRSVTH
jgi:hypothetical protein